MAREGGLIAVTAIEELFAPLHQPEFLERYWSKDFLFCKQGAVTFQKLFDWKSLNKALTEHRIAYPRVRLMRSGVMIPPEEFTTRRHTIRGQEKTEFLNVPAINSHLVNGASLIVNAVEELDSSLKAACRKLSSAFLGHVSANAYASFGSDAGFPVHWDDHEVIVIQLTGQKRWRVFEPARKHPLADDVEGNTQPPSNKIWEGILQPGDSLYIPRGYWHEVVPVGEPTLHLSLSVIPPTSIDWLSWIVEKAAVFEELRKNIPMFADEQSLFAFQKSTKEIFTRLIENETLQDYLESRKGRLSPRPAFSLPFAVSEGTISASTMVRLSAFCYYSVEDYHGENKFLLGALDKNWFFDNSAKPILDELLTLNPCSVESLLKKISINESELIEFLQELLVEGLLEVVDAGA